MNYIWSALGRIRLRGLFEGRIRIFIDGRFGGFTWIRIQFFSGMSNPGKLYPDPQPCSKHIIQIIFFIHELY